MSLFSTQDLFSPLWGLMSLNTQWSCTRLPVSGNAWPKAPELLKKIGQNWGKQLSPISPIKCSKSATKILIVWPTFLKKIRDHLQSSWGQPLEGVTQQARQGFFGSNLNNNYSLSRPGPWKKKFERLIFPTKYVIPKSLKFSHWPSKMKK